MWNEDWTYQGMMGWADGSGHWMSMGLHGVIWVLLIGLLVAMVVLLTRGRSRGRVEDGAGSPAAILDARYARGEIGREEYLERKRDLP